MTSLAETVFAEDALKTELSPATLSPTDEATPLAIARTIYMKHTEMTSA